MKSSIKIWEVIPTLCGGGAEQMIIDLVKGLKDQGFDVTLISLYDETMAASNRLEKVKEYGLNVCYLNKTRGFDLKLLIRIWRMIKGEKPDIIHSHICSFTYISVLRLFCSFIHVHTMHSIAGNVTGRIYRALMRLMCMNKKTMFVALNEYTKKTMFDSFSVSDERITCISNGVDLAKFRPINRKRVQGLQVISIGSLTPVKNQDLLLKAFANVEKLRGFRDRLIILGEGELRSALEKEIELLGITEYVDMPGNVGNVEEYLHASDIFVLTSRYEGVSLALLEAAATGLPLICSRTGGTPEVVQDSAVLFEDNDLDGLQKALLCMLNEAVLREEYGQKATCVARMNTLETMNTKYASLFREIAYSREK